MASEEITHDQTIPFHIWDDVPYARAICLNVTLRFDEILDHVKLNESLAQLFQDKDWRKLGSRVRQNVSILRFFLSLSPRVILSLSLRIPSRQK